MPKKSADATDIDIVRRVLAGDVNAFEKLVTRYQAYVFSIVRKHVPLENVEAVAHDIFVRAYRSLPGYGQQSEFAKWLAGISVRTCAGFWRERYRRREVPVSRLGDAHRQWLDTIMADESVQKFQRDGRQQEAREILERALSQMGAQERMVLSLIHFEGCSVKEAAALMGVSAANVKIRAFRARKKLKKLLETQCD
ncbi:MAG TPA: RNA polymerase sigma factor [Desulfosalsimonadaceae bacterium]|nr:RNA polymerase sigma factor [Desulfosalsimonadaceae bacterium]